MERNQRRAIENLTGGKFINMVFKIYDIPLLIDMIKKWPPKCVWPITLSEITANLAVIDKLWCTANN